MYCIIRGTMQAALAFLSVIDPDAFEIAFEAVPVSRDAFPDLDDLESEGEWCGG
jgi:hypothetical protein